MAHIETIDTDRATGDLAAAYAAMAERPMPPAYRPPHGRAPGIVLAHSLDPALMMTTFSFSGALWADAPLDWPARELINAVTSLANQCFY